MVNCMKNKDISSIVVVLLGILLFPIIFLFECVEANEKAHHRSGRRKRF